MKIEELHRIFITSSGVCTDTRKLSKDCVFFALKGGNFNGNKYALSALESGASCAVVDEKVGDDDRLVLVDDVLNTLQCLANYHRQQLKGKVLALTGSNGKTTSKELIHAVLSSAYNCRATRGNLNNHIGVPLTILETPLDTELLVVEMGANHQGEIKQLCEIAAPDYGMIVNIGQAHLEGFGGIDGVKKGKTEMYRFLNEKGGTVFFNEDESSIQEFEETLKDPIKYGGETTLQQELLSKDGELLELKLILRGEEQLVRTKLFGNYNSNNVLTAAAIGDYFKIPFETIVSAIEAYEPSNNRSQMERTSNANQVILDAYNANPTSMRNAVNAFAMVATEQDFFVLGDMLELGEASAASHKMILDMLSTVPGTKLLVGSEFAHWQSEFDFKFFDNVSELLDSKVLEGHQDKKFIIKGSRGVQLEKVFDLL